MNRERLERERGGKGGEERGWKRWGERDGRKEGGKGG